MASLACESGIATGRLQSFQVLDKPHSFLFGQLPTDHTVALWTVVELVPCIRIAGQIGAELSGAFERVSSHKLREPRDCMFAHNEFHPREAYAAFDSRSFEDRLKKVKKQPAPTIGMAEDGGEIA